MQKVHEYETLYILAPELNEEDQRREIAAVDEVISKNGGEILKSDVWGRRKLAYPIKKRTDGVYVLSRFRGGSHVPKELESYIKRTPSVLRHLTTVVTKQQLKEEARQRALSEKRAEEARIAAEEAAKREAEAEEARAAAAEAAKHEAEPGAEVASPESEPVVEEASEVVSEA